MMTVSADGRRAQRGQSFSTCLLIVVLFFGGIGLYYFKVFIDRDLEDPMRDLLVVEKTDPAELNFFRRRSVSDHIAPAQVTLKKLVDLRKATKRGTTVPDEFWQKDKEILNSLRDVMNNAKLRQIPKQYEKNYKDVLLGIAETYQSLRLLEEAVGTEIAADKERLVKDSVSRTQSAERRLKKARDFFSGGMN